MGDQWLYDFHSTKCHGEFDQSSHEYPYLLCNTAGISRLCCESQQINVEVLGVLIISELASLDSGGVR
jgi:hypothetical protein